MAVSIYIQGPFNLPKNASQCFFPQDTAWKTEPSPALRQTKAGPFLELRTGEEDGQNSPTKRQQLFPEPLFSPQAYVRVPGSWHPLCPLPSLVLLLPCNSVTATSLPSHPFNLYLAEYMFVVHSQRPLNDRESQFSPRSAEGHQPRPSKHHPLSHLISVLGRALDIEGSCLNPGRTSSLRGRVLLWPKPKAVTPSLQTSLSHLLSLQPPCPQHRASVSSTPDLPPLAPSPLQPQAPPTAVLFF